ncbi:MAG: hypothetical protein C4524_08555 [Candidatus Zixiibacteriota bacterium]|nr:MAG: hypothetical protein C4524_08555 [candidate division Zixibacteria bacterium]
MKNRSGRSGTRINSGAHPLAVLMILTALLLFSGCDQKPTEVEDYEPEPVLQGYLVRGVPVDRVFLEWVAPLEGYYDRSQYGIGGASMVIFPVGAPGDTLHLVQHSDPDSAWIYQPAAGESLVPQGGMLYRLEVKQPQEGVDLWAEALVPDTFSITWLTPPIPTGVDTLGALTREDSNLFLTWTGAGSAGGYNLNVTCLTPVDSLLPLDPDWDPEEDELEPEDINLSFFWPMRYDQREMLIPWFMFIYEGWHRLDVQAISEEYYDYGMSIFRIEQGFPIQPESNVQGGLGIFAGLDSHSYWVYMEKVE